MKDKIKRVAFAGLCYLGAPFIVGWFLIGRFRITNPTACMKAARAYFNRGKP